jgi:hypothetical protein
MAIHLFSIALPLKLIYSVHRSVADMNHGTSNGTYQVKHALRPDSGKRETELFSGGGFSSRTASTAAHSDGESDTLRDAEK